MSKQVYIIYGIIFKQKIEYIGVFSGTRIAHITTDLRRYTSSKNAAPGYRRLANRIRECKGAFTTVVLDYIITDSELELALRKDKYVIQHVPELNIRDMSEPEKCVSKVKRKIALKIVELDTEGNKSAGREDREEKEEEDRGEEEDSEEDRDGD